MKKLLLFFGFLISISCFGQIPRPGQDSLTISVSGVAKESNLNEGILNTRFSVAINTDFSTSYKWITTDDKGSFLFTIKIPADKKLVAFDINGEKSGYNNHYIHSIALNGKDTTVVFPMNFIRERICRDTWLPKPIFFETGICDSVQDSFSDLKTFIAFYKSSPELTIRKQLVVRVYNSFTEKGKIAKCRAEKIKAVLVKNGMQEGNFKIIVEGKKEFTYFYYQDGCHTEQEFKENIVLSKSSYKKASTEQKKEVEKLRQSVIFSWE